MDLVKDNRVSSGLPRKKIRCVLLWLNSCQAEFRQGATFTDLLPDLCSYTQAMHTIPPAKAFTPPSMPQPGKEPVLPVLATQRCTVSCDWTDKKILPPTSYKNMVSYRTVWTVFSSYFISSWITWFTCALLHFSPCLCGCKERLMFTGTTVSTSEQWWLGTLILQFQTTANNIIGCTNALMTKKKKGQAETMQRW